MLRRAGFWAVGKRASLRYGGIAWNLQVGSKITRTRLAMGA